jgi:acyl-CoA thioester hydrolase
MARIKIRLPEEVIFSTTLNIRITDINYGGHLGNDSVLSLIHEARVRFLNSHGFSEQNVDGVGIIMTDSVIVYSSESFYGDEIKFDIAIDDITNTGCDIYYHMTNNKSGKEVAKVKTGIVFFNYENKKVTRTPELFLEKFKYS